jgi:hypothetical protein
MHACGKQSVTFREKHKLQMFENKALSEIFGAKYEVPVSEQFKT